MISILIHNSVPFDESIQFDDALPDLSLYNTPNVVPGGAVPHNVGSDTLHNIDDTVSSDSGGGNDADSCDDLRTLIKTPLRLGKTLIIYHPHAQRPPEIVDTATLSLTREPQQTPLPTMPWAPFTSRDDFEQAELFIKHNCTNRLINDQLHLNQKQDSCDHHPDSLPPMKNTRDLHKILDEAGSDLDISLVSWASLRPIGISDIDEE
jgi:hypothetical protein